MSWRRFLVLVGGMSPRSRLLLDAKENGGPGRMASREEGLSAFHKIGR